MSKTKREIIQAAFNELGMGGSGMDMSAEDFADVQVRLDGLMAQWHSQGIELGFPIGIATEPDTDTNLPPDAEIAVICNLALQIAPSYGKAASPQTLINARQGFRVLLNKTTEIPKKRINTSAIPAGAGYYGGPFTPSTLAEE